MKTFKDLKFETDYGNGLLRWDGSMTAVMQFENGWGVKVSQGMRFHSSDDSYEMKVLKDGYEWEDTAYRGDILHYLEEDDITYFMAQIQGFEPTNNNL